MSGYIVILLGNLGIFGVVFAYTKIPRFKLFENFRFWDSLLLGVGALGGSMALWILGSHLQGLSDVHVLSVQARPINMFALATSAPWIILVSLIASNVTGNVGDMVFGLDNAVLDSADIREAKRLLRKGERQEAIAELIYVKNKYPEAYAPIFLLAILAEEDGFYEKAADYYRDIIQRFNHEQIAWTNASRNLALLLRERLNEKRAAEHLEAEIAKRNPDSKYKYSATADKEKLAKQRGKRKGKRTHAEKVDLNHARRLAQQGDHATAIALIKRYIGEYPTESRPYFELITLFEKVERMDDKAVWLNKVIHTFGNNDAVWADAALRLAGHRTQIENDPDAAMILLENVSKRMGAGEHGRIAREQLKTLRSQV